MGEKGRDVNSPGAPGGATDVEGLDRNGSRVSERELVVGRWAGGGTSETRVPHLLGPHGAQSLERECCGALNLPGNPPWCWVGVRKRDDGGLRDPGEQAYTWLIRRQAVEEADTVPASRRQAQQVHPSGGEGFPHWKVKVSVAQLCPPLCDPMDCSMPGFPVPHHLPEFAQVHVLWVGDAIQLFHPLSPSSPSAFNVSQHQGLDARNGLAVCIRWPKCWNFNFNISPSNKYSGLISFKIDWFDLLAVQESLKSLLQNHSSKASVFQHSVFFLLPGESQGWGSLVGFCLWGRTESDITEATY